MHVCVSLSRSYLQHLPLANYFSRRGRKPLGYLETIFPKGRQEGVEKSDGIVAIKKENRAVKKKGEKHSRPTFVTTGVV